MTDLDELRKIRDALVLFAQWVIAAHREECTDVDGGAIQGKLQELGLLVITIEQDPCGDDCRCAAYDVEWPHECVRVKGGVLP